MTEEQRDSLLIEMSKNIKTINNVLGEHSKEIVRLGENMARMEHELTEKIDKHSKEIVRLRKNMVKMEYELTDKITALFDLGEVNKDKFEETDLRIKGIENTLDWHDRRLIKLEMTD